MKNENTLEVGNNSNQESQGKWQTAIEMVKYEQLKKVDKKIFRQKCKNMHVTNNTNYKTMRVIDNNN